MTDKYDQCQGDGTESGRVHDDLSGIIGIIIKFHGKHSRVDGSGDGTVYEEDDSSYGRERAGHENIGSKNDSQADGGHYEEF